MQVFRPKPFVNIAAWQVGVCLFVRMAKSWDGQAKWMGNLIPFLFWAPFSLIGLALLFIRHDYRLSIALLAIGQIAGWLALNYTGLFNNKQFKIAGRTRFEAAFPGFKGEAIFVGFAKPNHKSMLDPHQDLGYLGINESEMVFAGEDGKFSLDRRSITGIKKSASIHTLLAMGGWIRVDASTDDKPITIYFEPREKGTLIGNNRYRKKMVGRLREWKATGRLVT